VRVRFSRLMTGLALVELLILFGGHDRGRRRHTHSSCQSVFQPAEAGLCELSLPRRPNPPRDVELGSPTSSTDVGDGQDACAIDRPGVQAAGGEFRESSPSADRSSRVDDASAVALMRR
jgi:hypothetical protein